MPRNVVPRLDPRRGGRPVPYATVGILGEDLLGEVLPVALGHWLARPRMVEREPAAGDVGTITCRPYSRVGGAQVRVDVPRERRRLPRHRALGIGRMLVGRRQGPVDGDPHRAGADARDEEIVDALRDRRGIGVLGDEADAGFPVLGEERLPHRRRELSARGSVPRR